jgi:ribosomal protein S6
MSSCDACRTGKSKLAFTVNENEDGEYNISNFCGQHSYMHEMMTLSLTGDLYEL